MRPWAQGSHPAAGEAGAAPGRHKGMFLSSLVGEMGNNKNERRCANAVRDGLEQSCGRRPVVHDRGRTR